MKKTLCVLVITALVAGCATNRGSGANYNPIVDRPGPNYSQDLIECQAYATQVMSTADSAAAGAIAGALLAGVIGAAFGLRGSNLGGLATFGAVDGGLKAGVSAEGGQRGIIMRCLAGRGYNVLG